MNDKKEAEADLLSVGARLTPILLGLGKLH